jgi:type I restriction enzyme S subunit
MKWERVELGNLVSITGGGTPNRKNEDFWNGGIPWATVKDLSSFYLNSTIDSISEAGLKNSAANLIESGSVIIATRVGLGKVCITNIKTAINQDLKAVIPKKALDKQYLFYFLISKSDKIISLGKGATVKGITLDNLKSLQIPLPPLSEQRRLAARLDKADAVRQKSRALVDVYAELGRSVFLEVFGDDKLVQFKKTKLSEVADVVSGVAKGKKYKETNLIEIPYMRVANVQDGYLDLEEIKNLKVPQKEIDRYLLEKGDVLLTEGGDPDKLGRGHVWNQEVSPCIHQNHIYRVRLNQTKLLPIFFSAYVGSKYGKKYFLRAAKQTTGIATINLTQLRNFPTILPPLPLQTRFAAMVANIEGQRRLAERQLEAAEAVFGGVLQGTFEG